MIPQIPAEHVGVPFVELQANPHTPQLAVLDAVLVSQPFDAIPSQSPQPGSHTVTRHAPEEHDSVACGRSQIVSHAPQSVSARRFLSQPSDATPLQLPHPGLQPATVHTPPEHPDVPFGVTHAAPQPPQLAGSVVVVVSQPLLGSLSQSAVPGSGQVEHPQLPAVHLGVHTEDGHLFGQVPQ